MMRTKAIILAAGKGTRMKSDKSKVMHELLGKPIIFYVVEALEIPSRERIGLVVGEHNIAELRGYFGDRVDYILQKEALGTGHAVMAAESWLKGFDGNLIIVVGDAPLISKDLMNLLIEKCTPEFAGFFLSAYYKEPPPYGRVIRNGNGDVQRIVEDRDATPEEKLIGEVSSSHYCFDVKKLFGALQRITRNNDQNEYYLPDVIEKLVQSGKRVGAVAVDDPFITFGINSQADLQKAEKILHSKMQLN